jgi:hypothetical protein
MANFHNVLWIFHSSPFKFDMDKFNVEFLPLSVNIKISIEHDEDIQFPLQLVFNSPFSMSRASCLRRYHMIHHVAIRMTRSSPTIVKPLRDITFLQVKSLLLNWNLAIVPGINKYDYPTREKYIMKLHQWFTTCDHVNYIHAHIHYQLFWNNNP